MAIAEAGQGEELGRSRSGGIIPPDYVDGRIKRSIERRKEGEAIRQEATSFFQGNQHAFIADQMLHQQPTTTSAGGAGKPQHKFRRTFNLLTTIVGHKVSTSIKRVPDYQVNPSSRDQEDIDAAALSQKILRYGYDKWDVRSAMKDIITYALVSDEGFVMPYFDTNLGPFTDGPDGPVGEGEVRIRTYSADEVSWEPGVNFNDARYYVVEQARAMEDVRILPGFIEGVGLRANAEQRTGRTGERYPANAKLVMVREYFERPSQRHAKGRWFTIANDQIIVKPQDYPCQDNGGKTLDEPILARLTFVQDPHSDRGMGLGRLLVDFQRTFNQLFNRQLEWAQMALVPQWVAKNIKLAQKRNDVPGAVFEAWGSGDVEPIPVPPMPPELENMKQSVRESMQYVAADQDIPQGVEAARGIQAAIERDEGVWSSFYGDVAEVYSRLARHCLYLVQRFYPDERTIRLRGEFGPESLTGFHSAQLRGQADVTVLPESITPRTRQEMEARIRYYAESGWITPEVAMAAINSGAGESLIDSYQRDVGRAERIIQRLKEDPEGLLAAGDPESPTSTWMPRPQDNIRVHIAVFGDWMKTEEYETLPVWTQDMAVKYYEGLRQLEQEQAMREQMQQAQIAQGLGMGNAARPGGDVGMPQRNGPETGISGPPPAPVPPS